MGEFNKNCLAFLGYFTKNFSPSGVRLGPCVTIAILVGPHLVCIWHGTFGCGEGEGVTFGGC